MYYFLVYDKFDQGATDLGSHILGWVAGRIILMKNKKIKINILESQYGSVNSFPNTYFTVWTESIWNICLVFLN